MDKDKDLIRFNVVRNALYHTARRRTNELYHKLFSFTVILLGAGSMSTLAKVYQIDPVYFGVGLAVVGTLQLVFDFSGKSHEHRILQKEYTKLLADIEGTTADNADLRAKWWGRMIEITADEPPVLRAVDAKAYNDAIDATHIYARSERLKIPVIQRVLGLFFTFEGHEYKKFSDGRTWWFAKFLPKPTSH
jgi:hypothetical protein